MKNKVKKVFTKENLLLAIAIIFLASIVMPVLYACRYVIPSADDFGVNNEYIASNSNNLLLYLLQTVVHFYFNWQGTYFLGMFFEFPLLYLGGLSAVKLFLFIAATAFFCAFLVSVKEGCQWMVVGDSTIDIQTGKNARLRTVLVKTGVAGTDGKYDVQADIEAAD